MFQWNDYKDNQRNGEPGEEHLKEYFNGNFQKEGHNGFFWDVNIIFLGKTRSRPSEVFLRKGILKIYSKFTVALQLY